MKLSSSEIGQGIVEYAFLLVFVVIVVIVILQLFGISVFDIYVFAITQLSEVFTWWIEWVPLSLINQVSASWKTKPIKVNTNPNLEYLHNQIFLYGLHTSCNVMYAQIKRPESRWALLWCVQLSTTTIRCFFVGGLAISAIYWGISISSSKNRSQAQYFSNEMGCSWRDFPNFCWCFAR